MPQKPKNAPDFYTFLRRVVLAALLVRLLAFGVVMLSGTWSEGFMNPPTDDYRYETGAGDYAAAAGSLWDRETFTKVFDAYGDWVGHRLDQPFDVAPLWYLIACMLRYLTGSALPLRMLNLLFSSLAVWYTGVFTKEVYGEKAAKITSAVLAFLPFAVFYSCFVFKEQLVMLLTMVLLCHAVLIRKHRFRPIRLLSTVFCALCLLTLRSGVSAVLLALCALFALWRPGIGKKLLHGEKRTLYLVIAAGVCCLALLVLLFPTIRYKLDYYLSGNADLDGVSIRFIAVSGVRDLYKLPLTWLYAMISPISLFHPFTCYYDVVCVLNITLIPVAVGAALYLFRKKPDPLVYFGCLAYYLVSIIPSIAIFRHYFSLLPLTLSSFGAFTASAGPKGKKVWLILSGVFLAVVFAYYLWRNVLRT